MRGSTEARPIPSMLRMTRRTGIPIVNKGGHVMEFFAVRCSSYSFLAAMLAAFALGVALAVLINPLI